MVFLGFISILNAQLLWNDSYDTLHSDTIIQSYNLMQLLLSLYVLHINTYWQSRHLFSIWCRLLLFALQHLLMWHIINALIIIIKTDLQSSLQELYGTKIQKEMSQVLQLLDPFCSSLCVSGNLYQLLFHSSVSH